MVPGRGMDRGRYSSTRDKYPVHETEFHSRATSTAGIGVQQPEGDRYLPQPTRAWVGPCSRMLRGQVKLMRSNGPGAKISLEKGRQGMPGGRLSPPPLSGGQSDEG